jgi:hypothetical protein
MHGILRFFPNHELMGKTRCHICLAFRFAETAVAFLYLNGCVDHDANEPATVSRFISVFFSNVRVIIACWPTTGSCLFVISFNKLITSTRNLTVRQSRMVTR